jgi:hypothetical protein
MAEGILRVLVAGADGAPPDLLDRKLSRLLLRHLTRGGWVILLGRGEAVTGYARRHGFGWEAGGIERAQAVVAFGLGGCRGPLLGEARSRGLPVRVLEWVVWSAHANPRKRRQE